MRRRSTSDRYYTNYLQSIALLRTRRKRVAAVVGAVVLVVLPSYMSGSDTVIATSVLLAIIGAAALNLLIGNIGIISLGQAAFLGAGAFTATYLAIDLELPFPLVIVLCGIVTGVLGGLIGVPSLRWRGLYIILGTFALHFIVRYVLIEYEISKVGPGGFNMPDASVFGWSVHSHNDWYYLALGLTVAMIVVSANLLRSRVGRAWTAVRDRDVAAAISGINVAQRKVVAFAVTSAVVGMVGALNAYFIGHVTAANFELAVAIQYIAMVIIGGMGSLLGSVLGASFVVMLPHVIEALVDRLPESYPLGGWVETNIFDIQVALYGALIVAFLLVEPGGLAALWKRARIYFELWPFKQRRLSS